ncbi:uncharacterized protein N7506_012149 [Penicillium brevicompactum]|uniref:uncharacterized protein n=1 Tax=Penicillium brevicompactum TaxID=5074 RepID=UPI00254021DE|nr:uncharacterized protein N7506_012149 [Penicillium brevicompactum]KAJ5319445.1 hypothetical protein N7506_012149 [Penicillium brevicompactum]
MELLTAALNSCRTQKIQKCPECQTVLAVHDPAGVIANAGERLGAMLAGHWHLSLAAHIALASSARTLFKEERRNPSLTGHQWLSVAPPQTFSEGNWLGKAMRSHRFPTSGFGWLESRLRTP